MNLNLKLISSGVIAVIITACASDTFITAKDVIEDRVGIRYRSSDQCLCPQSQEAYVVGLNDKSSIMTYDETVSGIGGGPETNTKKITIPADSIDFKSIALGCTIGILDSEAEAGSMCQKNTAYSYKSRGPTTKVPSSFRVIKSATNLSLVNDDIEGANYCAAACSSGNPFLCFPLGNSFPTVTKTLVDLYDSAVRKGYSKVPAKATMAALGISSDMAPTNCQRGDTSIDDTAKTVENKALIDGPENWSCGISSLQMASASFKEIDPNTPAFTVHFPNTFVANILDPAGDRIATIAKSSLIKTRILSTRDFRNGLLIEFPEMSQLMVNGKQAYGSSFSTINSMFEIDGKLVLRTQSGCLSMMR